MLKRLGTSENWTHVSLLSIAGLTSAQAVTGECAMHGILLKTDGANNVTLNLFDGLSVAAPRITLPNLVVPGTALNWALSFDPPIYCSDGIFVGMAVAGGGAATWQIQYADE